MSASFLLDANALIALLVTDHEHHHRAATWAATADGLAVCPTVQGALVRFLVRCGESPSAAIDLVGALERSSRCDFWPDDLSYAEASLTGVTGHRQVTDAYLASLAVAHGAILMTFDRALVAAHPRAAALIP